MPVAIKGSFDAWSKVSGRIRLAPIKIKIGDAIDPKAQDMLPSDPDTEYAHITQKVRTAVGSLLAMA